MKIKITKRAEVTGGLPAATEHTPGTVQPETHSLPIDYWITGELQNPIEVGKPVLVLRESRNGVPMLGIFQSTEVTEVTLTTFRTKNSVYEYSYLTADGEQVSLTV